MDKDGIIPANKSTVSVEINSEFINKNWILITTLFITLSTIVAFVGQAAYWWSFDINFTNYMSFSDMLMASAPTSIISLLTTFLYFSSGYIQGRTKNKILSTVFIIIPFAIWYITPMVISDKPYLRSSNIAMLGALTIVAIFALVAFTRERFEVNHSRSMLLMLFAATSALNIAVNVEKVEKFKGGKTYDYVQMISSSDSSNNSSLVGLKIIGRIKETLFLCDSNNINVTILNTGELLALRIGKKKP
jgi:hypothetical protein